MGRLNCIGQSYGELTILEQKPSRRMPNGMARSVVRCRCNCGKEKDIDLCLLRSGQTKSCGCLKNRSIKERSIIHGMSNSKEFGTLMSMKQRCYNKKSKFYSYYGGRGILICDRWLEKEGKGFINFYEDMGKAPSAEHSIDRIDNDKGYFPDNCRWSKMDTQCSNKRNNINLTFNGKTQCVSAWARELEIPVHNLKLRLERGLSLEESKNYDRKKIIKMTNIETGEETLIKSGKEAAKKYKGLYRLLKNGKLLNSIYRFEYHTEDRETK